MNVEPFAQLDAGQDYSGGEKDKPRFDRGPGQAQAPDFKITGDA
jgi:hypothetical protein